MPARVTVSFYSLDTDRPTTIALKQRAAAKIKEAILWIDFDQNIKDLGSILLEINLDFERLKPFEKIP